MTLFWARRMGEDARNAQPRVALAFSEAFCRLTRHWARQCARTLAQPREGV